MTSEQLQNARAERWRQVSNPVLTADDARAWLNDIGFCLFLPRRAHASGLAFAPAPSFVEAVAGLPSEVPSREAIENATALLHGLTADGAVVPLNLFGAASAFGAAGGGASDQPDFVVTREALPYVFSLIGGRNWKSGPGAKASPLVLEIWKQLDGEGAQTATEIQAALGREVTEGAVLRGLMELWNGLRAIPVYDGETTRWELTQARFAAEMTASQKVAQTTALSALVSLYLDAVVAASSEEIETFLSPLTARSRVREVVNGLQATRQLGLISVAAQPLLHVAGSLPEFAEEEPVEVELRPRTAPFERKARTAQEGGAARKPYERGVRRDDRGSGRGSDRGFDRGRGGLERLPSRERTGPPRERTGPPRERTGPPRERTGFGRQDGERFAAKRSGDAPFRPKSGGERPYRRPDDRKPFGGERRPEDRERRPFGKKPFDKKPFDKTAKPFRPRSSDGPRYSSRPFDRERAGSERARPSAGREGERPFRPRREEGSGSERGGERRAGKFGGAGKFSGEKKFGAKKFGAGKSFGGPKFGARSSSGPRSAGSAGPRSYGPRSAGSRTGSPRTGSRPSGPRPSGSRPGGSGRPSFSGGFKREATGEKRPFFRERPARDGDGESRPRSFRSDASAGPAKRAGGWKPKPSGGGFAKSGKPAFRSSGKPGFKSGGKPGFKSGGKPAFGKTGSGKTGFGKTGKPIGKSGKPFGRSGKPAFGGSKPGGFKPPFRKRKDEGSKNAE